MSEKLPKVEIPSFGKQVANDLSMHPTYWLEVAQLCMENGNKEEALAIVGAAIDIAREVRKEAYQFILDYDLIGG